MISRRVVHVPKIIVGVDTHKEEHVAVVIDKLGARMGQLTLPTTNMGYVALERWARTLGEIEAIGVEGTGSYGAGLARFLRGQGHTVIEVNRPDRSTRHRLGKATPRMPRWLPDLCSLVLPEINLSLESKRSR